MENTDFGNGLVLSVNTLTKVIAWAKHDKASDTTPYTGFYTKGRLLVKSNLIYPVLNINIHENICISQGNVSSDNLPENLVWTPEYKNMN